MELVAGVGVDGVELVVILVEQDSLEIVEKELIHFVSSLTA